MEVGGQRHPSAALAPGGEDSVPVVQEAVGLSAGLDGCGKCSAHRDSIPGQSSP